MGVKFVGDWNKAIKAFKKLSSPNFDPLLNGIGLGLIRETTKRFKDSADPSGKKWQKLAKGTIENRRSRKDKPTKSTKILVDTALLRNSVTKNVSKEVLEVGSPLEYSRVHQFGFKKKKIAARPFLGISKRDEDFIQNAVFTFIQSKLKGK